MATQGQPIVEMRPAYNWTCEECGRDNFERAIVVDIPEEHIAAFCEENDVDPELCQQPGYFVTYPGTVTCKACEAKFTTQSCHDDGGEFPSD